MAQIRGNQEAFGHPGIEPRWTHGGKEGIGTAYSTSSRAWFTLWNGVLTEIFYPTIDKPQTRDLQYLISDGETFFQDEKKHLYTKTERLGEHALGYRVTNTDPQGRYRIRKEIINDPHLPCILQYTCLEGEKTWLDRLHLYALCAPHLEIGGCGNNGYVLTIAGNSILTAQKEGTWLAMAATIPYRRLSVGYVGKSDGWQDLAENYQMDWEFDTALDGNIALTGELDLSASHCFTLGLAFGNTQHRALTCLFQALDIPFPQQRDRFQQQWNRTCRLDPLEGVARDRGNLYRSSVSLILAHEDKAYQGAIIASLSIPWGQTKADNAQYGGYHLVWPRDLYNSASALLAAGLSETPLRTLIYLATSQNSDGSFPQNFWIDGRPDRQSIQLDEVAYPILLAWKLYNAQALRNFDPYPMVLAAASYIIRSSPVTPEERWEQSSGFSPATLATTIAALICAACWSRDRYDIPTAEFIEAYADFLACHIEAWTVTTQGTLVPDIPTHYIRLTPAQVGDPHPNEDPNQGMLYIPHRHPDSQQEFPAKDIVDPSFLQLVRYGIRHPQDPIIQHSLAVVDRLLKTDTPNGPVWRRYNHDGHGQREDGTPWQGWGTGRSWPLLTSERGMYEFAAGNDPTPYIQAMERFASSTGLIPEQVWDSEDLPAAHMYRGYPTGSAMPLVWAHSEYIKLLRSVFDEEVYDTIPAVSDRYSRQTGCNLLEIWQTARQVRQVKANYTLRIQREQPFRLCWSRDEWQTHQQMTSIPTAIGIEYVDIQIAPEQRSPIRFHFLDLSDDREHQIAIAS